MIKLRNLSRFTFRVLSGCCLFTAMTFTVHAQPLTFTTFAGSAGGPGSADGTGSAARFNTPLGVAADSAGNIVVADRSNHTIRKISPSGAVTTLAGSAGFSGSGDGTGSAARFNSPRGVAADNSGNVYVSDTDNQTIRKITPAGVVTTLAGSPGQDGSAEGIGSAARFQRPWGMSTDSLGNVYVADRDNHTIRKITPAGVVTTVAGSAGLAGDADGTGSAARFRNPLGVATDSAGNLYVADLNNRTIRKITPAGVVTTLAGSSANFPGSADGTGSAARFNDPAGVAVDSGGNVYVADASNDTIRKITAAGVVTTLAGSATESPGSVDGVGSAARFDEPIAVATDSAGNVYVADANNHKIRKVVGAGVVTTLAGGSAERSGFADGTGIDARFDAPEGVAADFFGRVYVADTGNCTIRKISAAGVVTTFAGSPLAIGSADGTGSAARFRFPSGVATDDNGNVAVADSSNNNIRKITPTGVVTTLAGVAGVSGSADGTGSAARFNSPSGVAIDFLGTVTVADTDNHTIRKITAAGVVTTLSGSPGVSGSSDGSFSAARFRYPGGVATDGGSVYVADTDNNVIRKIALFEGVTTLAGSSSGSADGAGTAARFSTPSGVATDSSGNIYVADTGNRTIRKITPAGVVTTLAGLAGLAGSEDGTGSAARFISPKGVAIDGNGNVYVADHHKIRVGRRALADIATIDSPSGSLGTSRQLGTSSQNATSWQWRIIRQPSGSNATLSSTSIRNPVFTPDVADLFIFQLTASDGVKTSITNVELTATPVKPGPRHRAVGH